MTLTLELSEEQETRLAARATAAGMDDPRQYLIALIDDEADNPMPRTGAEVLAYWQREGVAGLFADKPDSPELARQMREAAQSSDHAA